MYFNSVKTALKSILAKMYCVQLSIQVCQVSELSSVMVYCLRHGSLWALCARTENSVRVLNSKFIYLTLKSNKIILKFKVGSNSVNLSYIVVLSQVNNVT